MFADLKGLIASRLGQCKKSHQTLALTITLQEQHCFGTLQRRSTLTASTSILSTVEMKKVIQVCSQRSHMYHKPSSADA